MTDEAVMVAAHARALVRTCYDGRSREPFQPRALNSCVLLTGALRYGLDTELIDIGALAAVPAPELIGSFGFPAPIAGRVWRMGRVSSIVHETMQRSTGATQQRQAYKRAGRWEDVDLVVRETQQKVNGEGRTFVFLLTKNNFGCHWIR